MKANLTNKMLICVLAVGCLCQSKNAISAEQHCITPIDTSNVIMGIKRQYAGINAAIASYTMIVRDMLGQSTEGGCITGYYEKADLKKAIAAYYGEMGKVEIEYYFNNGELFFSFSREYQYDKPIYLSKSKIISIEENRYYFFQARLIKWLDKNKKSVKPNTKKFRQQAEDMKEEVVTLKKRLGNILNVNHQSYINQDKKGNNASNRGQNTQHIHKHKYKLFHTFYSKDGALLGKAYALFKNNTKIFTFLIITHELYGKTDTLYCIKKTKFISRKGIDTEVPHDGFYGYKVVLKKNDYIVLVLVNEKGEGVSDNATIEWNYDEKLFRLLKTP